MAGVLCMCIYMYVCVCVYVLWVVCGAAVAVSVVGAESVSLTHTPSLLILAYLLHVRSVCVCVTRSAFVGVGSCVGVRVWCGSA